MTPANQTLIARVNELVDRGEQRGLTRDEQRELRTAAPALATALVEAEKERERLSKDNDYLLSVQRDQLNRADGLVRECADLRAQLAEAEADRARLDWLEKEHGTLILIHTGLTYKGPTLRSAIDAARKERTGQ